MALLMGVRVRFGCRTPVTVPGFRFRVLGLGVWFQVSGFDFRFRGSVSGFGVQVSEFSFLVSKFRTRVAGS